MKQRELTPAEREEERKKREELWWKKVITYYLNQMYHEEVDREVEKYRPEPLIVYMAGYIREHRMMQKLYEKEQGKLSAFEILQKMDKYQEEDSPFRELLHELKDNPQKEEKINNAISKCVETAPQNIIERTRRQSERRKHRRKADPVQAKKEAEQEAREDQRTKYEMTFLRCVMPPELYRSLCSELTRQGREVDPEKDFLFIEEQEREGPTYEEYVERHKVDPRVGDERLENMDEVFTAAAYMLAAYEQKDEPEFDEKQADIRAMEISGTKAFRAYMESHPGSLLAAARNTGLEATHRELSAMNAKLDARNEILTSVHDAMKRKSSGQTAAFHRIMNQLNRFVSSPTEPTAQERDALSMKLAQFVMTEGNPSNLNYKKDNCMLAARALKALLPKRDFDAFLNTANAGRAPGQKLQAEELEGPVPPQAAQPVQGPEGPALRRNEQ